MRSRVSWIVWTTVWAALLPAGPGAAQESSPSPAPDIGALVAQLASADWSVRDRADAELRAVQPPGLAVIEPFLSAPVQSAEQSVRLLEIARARFESDPHAGMGVGNFDMVGRMANGSRFGVVIGSVVSGFDAAEKLKPGDAILAMDGQPIAQPNDLIAGIISHSPGDTVTLAVLRASARLEIDVALRGFNDLNNAQKPSAQNLARALQLRLDRASHRGTAHPVPVLDELVTGSRADLYGATGRPTPVTLLDGDFELAGLLVGGEARGGRDDQESVTPAGSDARLSPVLIVPDRTARQRTIIVPPRQARPAPAHVQPPSSVKPPAPRPAPPPGE